MLIVVTNRLLCKDNFLKRIEEIAKCKPEKIILREKDMTKDDYYKLALECKRICDQYGTPLVINSFFDVAREIGVRSINVSFDIFMKWGKWDSFDKIGVSIHSVDEVRALSGTKASYIIAGHVFQTDCKKNLKPRGLEFLKEACANTKLPVFGIGGINEENMPDVIKCGAKGVCVMSGMMTCNDVKETIAKYYK